MSLSYFIKKKQIEQLRTFCNNKDIEKITEFLQEIENKKAKEQNRTPAIVNVERIGDFEKEDDEFLHEENVISIYFKESRTAPDIYKSFAHEEKHALQFYLSNRDLDALSTFEKETSIAHKLSFCYNIDDDLDLPSIQYLYNYNELDSKVEEIQELLNFIKNDIEHPDRYKSILRDILEFCEIYNKQDFKEYQKWLINHYEKHHQNPEDDPHCVMPSVIKMEKKFNINIRHFIKSTLDDLHRNKYQQLISLKRELSKLFNIIQQPPEKRDMLLEKYKKKEIKKIHNFINNEER